MKTIYIVTDGDYSDYHIAAVYSSRELAGQHVAMYGGGVEEYGVDAIVDLMQKGYKSFLITMQKDGNVPYKYNLGTPRGKSIGFRHYDPFELVVTLNAKSERHAVKIASDMRAQIIAANLWPENREQVDRLNKEIATTDLLDKFCQTE